MLTLLVKYKTFLSILVFLGLFFVIRPVVFAHLEHCQLDHDNDLTLVNVDCDSDARTLSADLKYNGSVGCYIYNLEFTKYTVWDGDSQLGEKTWTPNHCEPGCDQPPPSCQCMEPLTAKTVHLIPVTAPEHLDDKELKIVIRADYYWDHTEFPFPTHTSGHQIDVIETPVCVIKGNPDAGCKREGELCMSKFECCGGAEDAYRCWYPEGAGVGSCEKNPDSNYIPPEVREYTGPIVNYQGLIDALYAILMPAAILLFGLPLIILNGYKIMTSQGNPQKIQEGKEGLTSAIIGLIFVLLAMSILRIILNLFIGADTGP